MTALFLVFLLIIVLVVGLVAFGITGFNKLRKADIAAQEALGGIDVQLTRRAELIPNLVNTVKGYAAHERGVFEAVTEARARVDKAAHGNNVAEKAAADAQMSQALVNVMAVAEAYPDLKANTQFLDLQRQLAETENQLAFSRQYYNDAVTQLNTAVQTIPWMFFAGVAGVSKREFYDAPDAHTAAPTVDFGTGQATGVTPGSTPPPAHYGSDVAAQELPPATPPAAPVAPAGEAAPEAAPAPQPPAEGQPPAQA